MMTGRVSKPAQVFFFIESGGEETGTLSLSLTHDDPDDIRVPVQDDELVMLQGLYALAPDKFRRLMNVLVNAAYQAGSADKEKEISAQYQDQERLEALEISEALKTGRGRVIEIIDGIPRTI